MSEDEKLLKEAKKLPWEDRLAHKNWKVRNDANIDLAAVCDSITDPKDPRIREFGELGLLIDLIRSELLFPNLNLIDPLLNLCNARVTRIDLRFFIFNVFHFRVDDFLF